MTKWVEQMQLKERAEEDIYFARRDRELIEAMRRRRGQFKQLLKQPQNRSN